MSRANGQRDALVEALAGRLAEHARRVRHDTAEQIAAALRRAGIVGASIDASHLVGQLPPGPGGLPPDTAAELTDDLGVVLADDLGVVLTLTGLYAPANHAHPHTHPSSSVVAYRYSTNHTMADPGAGQVRFNSGTASAVTALALDDLTDAGTDVSGAIASLVAGDGFYFQVRDDAGTWGRYTLSGAPVDRTGWWDIPVTAVAAAGIEPVNNTPLLLEVTRQGAAGGGAPAAHHTTHEPGGTDPLAVDAAAATGSLRTLGTGAAQAAAGDHAHAAYVPAALVDAKGDLIAGTAADAVARVAAGADGTVLSADSTAAAGVSWAAPAATANLLTNPGLEQWQRGAGPFASGYTADRWQIALGGTSTMSVSREGTVTETGSLYALAVTYTHGTAASVVRQLLEDFTQLRGLVVTFSARVRTATASAARLQLYAGGVLGSSAFHAGTGAFATLWVTATVPAGATELRAQLSLEASCTAYLDNAVLVVGSTAPAYAPLHPAEDLARCQRYYEVWTVSALGDTFGHGHALSSSRAFVSIRFLEKAVVPTATRSAPSDFRVVYANANVAVAGAVALVNVNRRSAILDLSAVTGSPLTAGQGVYCDAATTSAALIFEANPF